MCDVFAGWSSTFDPPPYRRVTPPAAVRIDLGAVFGGAGVGRRADEVPLRVRAEGLNLADPVSGLLHAWARERGGSWVALCSADVPTGNGRGRVRIRQWFPSVAVTPIDHAGPA